MVLLVAKPFHEHVVAMLLILIAFLRPLVTILDISQKSSIQVSFGQ
jgi:hypothetical protein